MDIARSLRDATRHAAEVSLCAILVWAAAEGTAFGQSHWQLSPYRIQLLVAFTSAPELGSRARADLMDGMVERSESLIGAAWNMEAQPSPLAMQYDICHAASELDINAISPEFLKRDKLFALGIASTIDGYRVVAREFDCHTQGWSLPISIDVRQPIQLCDEAFRALLHVFRPTAKIGVDANRQAVLQIRGAALLSQQPSWKIVDAGDVFQVIVRRNERDGSPKPGGIQPVPWTFLVVDKLSDSTAHCTVHSGLQSPLNVRRRGHTELVALRVRSPRAPTLLRLRSRTDEAHALAGYEIYARNVGEESPESLGRTDLDGELTIMPGKDPLRILFIKHGSEWLARLPMMPGLEAVLTASVADDDIRLQAEGHLAGLRENLVDLVARRELLISRIQDRIDAGNYSEAETLLDQLRRLPTREQFANRVAQLRKKSVSKDPAVQAKIETLFNHLSEAIGKYLNPAPIDKLQTTLDRARVGERVSERY